MQMACWKRESLPRDIGGKWLCWCSIFAGIWGVSGRWAPIYGTSIAFHLIAEGVYVFQHSHFLPNISGPRQPLFRNTQSVNIFGHLLRNRSQLTQTVCVTLLLRQRSMPAFEAASLPSKFEGLWEVSVHARILQNLIEKTIEMVNVLTNSPCQNITDIDSKDNWNCKCSNSPCQYLLRHSSNLKLKHQSKAPSFPESNHASAEARSLHPPSFRWMLGLWFGVVHGRRSHWLRSKAAQG